VAVVESNLPVLSQLVSLAGRVAVVTGGGRGIGRAVAWRLAEAGATVTVADIDQASAKDAADEIGERFGIECFGASVDISESRSVQELARRTAQRSDRLDIWVNAAAIFATTALVDTPDEAWREILAIDLDGAFYCAREAAREMLARRGGGVIILFSSLSANKGRVGRSHYVAAKHGVKGLVRSLAVELAPAGIRVLAIAPSVTNTAALQLESQQGAQVDTELHDKMLARAIAGMPMGRMAEPDDLARATLFAACDLAQFMTGTTLHVDGGASAI
jgi:NAD(P)-dependent dehydrogenase (short-subunit alcohol dehydrogenase family)